jgi:hypothetical protein
MVPAQRVTAHLLTNDGLDPDAIPSKVDGRRISTDESLRRLGMRKERHEQPNAATP